MAFDKSSNHNMMIIDLEPVIALSRKTDALFNINTTLSADANAKESKEIMAAMMSRNSSKLSSIVLQELENKEEIKGERQNHVHFKKSAASD